MKTWFNFHCILFFNLILYLIPGSLAGQTQKDSLHQVITYLTGASADVYPVPGGGLFLVGGSTDVDSAVAWFLKRANGGDVVVLRARGGDGYNEYMYNLAPVNSVETIIIDTREKAALTYVTDKIRNAEALFISGGDQWNYVKNWKDTPVEDAINFLINNKKAVVGGTSAGLAIMGSAYYSAASGTSMTALEGLADPYGPNVDLGADDFLQTSFLKGTITDSHYTQRNRQGRHVVMMARLLKDFGYLTIKGIGIDEETALCIDEKGVGVVYGLNHVYFLSAGSKAETCMPKTQLHWNKNQSAIKVHRLKGSMAGNGRFDATKWVFTGADSFNYYVDQGVLK
jgi:cyanophycinase